MIQFYIINPISLKVLYFHKIQMLQKIYPLIVFNNKSQIEKFASIYEWSQRNLLSQNIPGLKKSKTSYRSIIDYNESSTYNINDIKLANYKDVVDSEKYF